MTLNKLGTTPNEEGGFSYDAHKNPLLIPNIWGNNYWVARPSPMNPATFASLSAASAVAAVLGGEVVPDPAAGGWNLLVPGNEGFTPYPRSGVYAVKLFGKEPFNAGYVCDVMGNDVAYPTARAKSEAICRDNPAIPFDAELAEKLFGAFSKFLVF